MYIHNYTYINIYYFYIFGMKTKTLEAEFAKDSFRCCQKIGNGREETWNPLCRLWAIHFMGLSG